jgi:hypothetical protein
MGKQQWGPQHHDGSNAGTAGFVERTCEPICARHLEDLKLQAEGAGTAFGDRDPLLTRRIERG